MSLLSGVYNAEITRRETTTSCDNFSMKDKLFPVGLIDVLNGSACKAASACCSGPRALTTTFASTTGVKPHWKPQIQLAGAARGKPFKVTHAAFYFQRDI
jgi:hypothetical protein